MNPDHTFILSLATICWTVFMLLSIIDVHWDNIILAKPSLNQKLYSLKTQTGRNIAKLISSVFFISLVASTNTISIYWITSVTLVSVIGLTIAQNMGSFIGARSTKVRMVTPSILWPISIAAYPFVYLDNILGGFSREPNYTKEQINEAANGPDDAIQNDPEAELDPHEEKMIKSILQLDETNAREVMIPRMDIVATDQSTSLEKVAELMSESGHSRIPIYEDTIDSIVGIIHSRDLLRHLSASTELYKLTILAHPPFFIPESKRLDELLRDFQEKRIHMAIVVDEYGGTAGLITLEDLLEEIVGEIEDEFDIPDSLIEMLDENEAIMDARITLEEVNDSFSCLLEGDGFDTLGGLLYQQMGRIPVPGDKMSIDNLDIKVISTIGRRIKKVHVVRAVGDSEI